MDTLTIGADPSLKAVFHSRRYGADGWLESYAVELRARDFNASTRVENPGFGHPPSQLFSELASSWQGWNGARGWLALEGEFEIQATSDTTGHITLNIKIPAYGGSQRWSAEARVLVEAGQLQQLANEAVLFFAKRDA